MSRARAPFSERWLFSRIIWAEYRRRYAKALSLLDRLAGLRPLKLHERALQARFLMLAGEPERAHDLLLAVREEAAARSDPQGDYIRRFADFWHAHLRRDPFNAREARRAADKIDCAPRLKRLLRIYPEQPDPIELEFDAWVKVNPPSAADLRKRPPPA